METTILGLGFRDITPIVENLKKQKMEIEMETTLLNPKP